jgi:ABC-type lipoprotein release transport system permease subunit
VALGILAAWATTRLLSRLLFNVSPTDPFVLAAVAAVLLGIAAVAAFAPARRASRIDPVEVLRNG